ncbi:MAG: hypothetical protein KME13_18445 [Myxacorys californica WJT36-NPBG1]|jgi:hypothetical protein|nr:hypothetical protein [Myxacorys californica WJT36-NPBG1]
MNITGLTYPLQIDPLTKNLKLSTNVDLIRDHIISYLTDTKKSHIMRPGYGTDDYLFQTYSSWDVIAAEIERSLTANVPQATFNVSGSLTDEGEGLIEVEWQYQGIKQEAIPVLIN